MEAVYGKALLFGTGVNLRLRTKPTHSLFFISNSTSDSSTTTDSKPNANKNKMKALIFRSKEKIRRRKQAELDDYPVTTTPTRRHSKGQGDTRVTHSHYSKGPGDTRVTHSHSKGRDDTRVTHSHSKGRDDTRVTHSHSKGRDDTRVTQSHCKGWGDTRVTHTHSHTTPLPLEDTNFFSLKSFKDIGCADFVIQSLRNLSFTRPSNIQAISYAPIIAGKSCIIADQSGSGKTLAYLVPIIQRLRQQELEGRHKSSSHAPTVLILAPTAELASQVLLNCRSISKSGVPFKSMVVTGGFAQKTQLESLKQGVDVLVATPGRFLFLVKEGFLQLTNLTCAVLDEVDLLFGDEDFEKALQCLINSSPVDTQYLFVTATLPKIVYSKLVEIFPDCEMVMGPSMHRISSRLEEIIIDCSGEGVQEKTLDTAFLNKKAALLKLAEGNRVPRTIVFCNKIETCRKVENALNRFDRKGIRMQVIPFHSAMTQESRLASMKEFKSSPSKEVCQFMVCTDRASRGMDFTGVDHVILFDYPRDPSEYVRRVGRTARGARGQGKAFIFVVGKQVSLARRISERNRKGHPLHDVPSAYES